jgi:hypothetical protein
MSPKTLLMLLASVFSIGIANSLLALFAEISFNPAIIFASAFSVMVVLSIVVFHVKENKHHRTNVNSD